MIEESIFRDVAAMSNATDVECEEYIAVLMDQQRDAKVPFSVQDDESAEWALRKLRAMRDDIAITKAQAAKIVGDLEKREARFSAYFGPQLEHYAASKLEGKSKSVRFLTGTVKFVDRKEAVKITDRGAALQFALQQRKWFVMQHVEILDTNSYLAHAQRFLEANPNNEPPPGVEYIPARRTYTIAFEAQADVLDRARNATGEEIAGAMIGAAAVREAGI